MSKAKQKQPAAPIKVIVGKSKPKGVKPAVPTVSKQQTLINLLRRPKGASLEELMEATGWQRHSVQGTLSGVLKKRLCLQIISEFGECGRMYRIADAQ